MYKLTDLYNHVHEFGFYDYVFISSGINDLSRYNYTAEHLSFVMRNTFKDLCLSFPETMFIFKSLTPTNIPWVNIAVDKFNLNMFSTSIGLFNFNFFDTYFVHKNINLLDKSGNGIHISQPIIHHLSSQIVTHIIHCIHRYTDTRDSWPLRPAYRDILYRRRMGGPW